MTTLVDRYGKAVFAGLLWRLWQHRDLLRELVRRDLHEAYAGSALSQAWAVLHPLLLVSLYGFVFGYVFTSQAGSDMPAEPDFAVFMLVGLATWMLAVAGQLSPPGIALEVNRRLLIPTRGGSGGSSAPELAGSFR